MSKKSHKPSRRNPIAQYAARFQRAPTFRDRTKYQRHNKHKGVNPGQWALYSVHSG